MRFPVLVVFNRKLNIVVNDVNADNILEYIKSEITQRKADNVIMERMSVTYKGTTSWSRTSLFGDITGNIILYKDGVNCHLRYQIDLRMLFSITAMMSLSLGLFAVITAGLEVWWISIVAFAWLCGANWITTYVRHGLLASELAEGIDNLMGWEKPQPEEKEKDESLKSWF